MVALLLTVRLKNCDPRDEAKESLPNLTSREAKILRVRFGVDIENKSSLQKVLRQFKITKERIRKIEEKALRELRERGPDNDGPDAA